MEEGDVASFVVQDLGLALEAENVPHRPPASKTPIDTRSFAQYYVGLLLSHLSPKVDHYTETK